MNEENNNSSNRHMRQVGFLPAVDYVLSNKVDALLWMTRMGTIMFTIFALVSSLGLNTYSSYQRALLCNAATSALRLHQRLPHVQLNTEFGAMLIMEDSCHYLLYSLLFIYSYPVPMALMPILLFAILHSANYSLTVLHKLGFADSWLAWILTTVVENQQRNILRFIALAEVCLLPFTVFMLFIRGAFLTPFAYYRFLTFRYASRRNPYTRNVLHELRLVVENFANTPGRSEVLRNLCFKIISTVSWLAPPVPPAQ